ncbi:bifunctional DNA-formamidopyrimidine glycosylase/DNA-(apurinic or apyrimidinic site) lyase [Hoyosella sp. YIM 151337]|uniref:bifunctional DNA-formamidopyrimidine glycosylase/DNA-(apurinic or apyrimidinic site) lyase n=1 Tax=Hoyosella sp. YIM 151337 TaxID=2992742 RepID=UPI0022360EC9|nr:bifunctional DNA-formamidopyrimidine glycosylase/DNA-(apurinic or apyrimidinic site) lyase [Hoyosella sp. YIM 151337]MCW4354511.1 bifunctional DNA-formamidopyrimidine glycosylase/DNA-(apurinic or apyrimidinic site) lyase [Hoyosella sp. YIM 151337]
MPELPEVEVVRRGLESHVVGRAIESVEVLHPRAVRRHAAGPADLAARLHGQTFSGAFRRGKYLWLLLNDGQATPLACEASESLLVHLGMSGQMLVQPASAPREVHARIVVSLSSGEQLRFVDQRTFGGWLVAPVSAVSAGEYLPDPVVHIARDPLDPRFDSRAVVEKMKRKPSEIKRVLLDQSVISGVGNIYADEALWRAQVHGNRLASALSRPKLASIIAAAHDVMTAALAQGGTSFDSLYVNVNGQSGYFSRSLAVYGRENQPCHRCGAPIQREAFMNRSSYSCPRCQPRPRFTGRRGVLAPVTPRIK